MAQEELYQPKLSSETFALSQSQTFYPGVGADEAMSELQRTVGEVTSFWAQVEDGLFTMFVVALTGGWTVSDLRPYRASFFAISSYESKMRMVDSAVKQRYKESKDLLGEWKNLKSNMDAAAALRNKVAHLIPMARSTTDKDAPANVRLVPPFWKGSFQNSDFDQQGFSLEQLEYEMAPYWGLRPPYHKARMDVPHEMLTYRLHMFSNKLINLSRESEALRTPPEN